MTKHSSRRKFLQQSGAVVAGSWLASHMTAVLAAGDEAMLAQTENATLKTLSSAEADGLGAMANQIWPPDETAGAVEIGVVYYMDMALAGFMAGALPMLREGLAELDALARESDPSRADFASMDFAQQTRLISAIESTGFFGTVQFMTLCGLFALPSYGGNRDQLGWKLIGFESRHVWEPPFGYYDAQIEQGQAHAIS